MIEYKIEKCPKYRQITITLEKEKYKDLIEGYLIPEVAKNNYIELGNILSDMLQDQIDITRKELLRNEF